MAFPNIPAQLQPILQQNFLARFLEEGLDSDMAYRLQCVQETVPMRLGSTIIMSRVGRLAPVPTPITSSAFNTSLDNGLTPANPSVEQYSYTMAAYAAAQNVDILGETFTIADQLRTFARTNGVQAAQTKERVAKNRLFAAYNGGNTFVRGDNGSNTTSLVHVDDIRGFQNVSVNGVLTPVSGSNPLTVTEVSSSSGGVNQVFTITGATADMSNNSAFPSDVPGVLGSAGISGTLTISPVAGSIPVAGDGLVAANAPLVRRPGGKTATTQLLGSDILNLSLILDSTAALRNNAVPPFPDGTYHCILDNISMRQLQADQQFMIAYAAQYQSREYMSGQMFTLMGVTFIPSTEPYVESPNAEAGVNVTVRRPIVMGAESLLQGNFEGTEVWLNRQGVEPIGNVMLVDGVAQVLRPPLDRLQMQVSLAWFWIGDFAVPTDLTFTSAIAPSATNALYKRCVVIETAG